MKEKSVENHIDLMANFPLLLGTQAEKTLHVVHEHLFRNTGIGYTGRAHDSGDDQIVVDHVANEALRSFILDQSDAVTKTWDYRLAYLSEEQDGRVFTAGASDPLHWRQGDLIVIADPLDGSTNAKCYGEGYSTVLVAFLFDGNSYWHIGGAIAASNGFTVVWSGLNWVYARSTVSVDRRWRQIRKARGKQSVSAAVATKVGRYSKYVRTLEEQKDLANVMAGTPCVYPLLALDLGIVVELNPQKVWDAAHLLPALLTGCSVMSLVEGDAWGIDDVLEFWHAYLDGFMREPEMTIVPPFRITAEPDSTSRQHDSTASVRSLTKS